MSWLRLALPLSLAMLATRVEAQQHWPFQFDVSMCADPGGTGALITQGDMSLPVLPTTALQALSVDGGTMKLWFWPENARLLDAIAAAGPTAMVWPTSPTICTKTDAFTIPTLLGPSPSGACTSADATIRQQLADLSACDRVDRPELYVLSYDPTEARMNTGSLEDLIGLAGQGFAQAGAPPEGILPIDFVPTLRTILVKLRHDKLATLLASTKAAIASAASTASSNASCFDAAALSTLQSGLGDLSSELDAASVYNDKTHDDGEAQALHETICLSARSRTRNALTITSLTDDERRFVAFWLGAVYWRMRGGGLIPLGSTQDARTYFLNNAFSRIGEMLGGQDGVDVAGKFYWQVVIEGWGEYMDMGTTAGGADKYADLVGMTNRGRDQAQPAVDLLAPRGYDTADLMTAGLQMGPGYYFAWSAVPSFRWATALPAPPYSAYIDSPTAVGEFNIGAALELGLAHVLLAGKPTGQPPTVDLCSFRTCGDDGCGGSCGTCATGTCVNGTCSDDTSGPIGDDAGAPADMGTTPATQHGCAFATNGEGSWLAFALLAIFVALNSWRSGAALARTTRRARR
jgi:hypothetical protein